MDWDYRPCYYPGVLDQELKPYTQCIGSTRNRKRCGVTSSNGRRLPENLKELFGPDGPSHVQLKEIAQALLCRKWHKDQAEGIAKRWINELKASSQATPLTPCDQDKSLPASPASVSSTESPTAYGVWDTPPRSRDQTSLTPPTPPSVSQEETLAVKSEASSPLQHRGSSKQGILGVFNAAHDQTFKDATTQTSDQDFISVKLSSLELRKAVGTGPRPCIGVRLRDTTSKDTGGRVALSQFLPCTVNVSSTGGTENSHCPQQSSAEPSAKWTSKDQRRLREGIGKSIFDKTPELVKCTHAKSQATSEDVERAIVHFPIFKKQIQSQSAALTESHALNTPFTSGHLGLASTATVWMKSEEQEETVGSSDTIRQTLLGHDSYAIFQEAKDPLGQALVKESSGRLSFDFIGAPVKSPSCRRRNPYKPRTAEETYAAAIKLLKTPLTEADRQRTGRIYVYNFPGHFGEMKIGRTTRPVMTRLMEWKRTCKHIPHLIYPKDLDTAIEMPHLKRVEDLIHLELHCRRFQEFNCAGCSRTHAEWFEVPEAHALHIIRKWANWMRSSPYDARTGRLVDQSNETVEQLCQWTPVPKALPPPPPAQPISKRKSRSK